ncbi:hypothetical protein NCS52_01299600 [Fusarium sp. LHS14.1]|nr:hypothetical protein NCS52_01299600 [Fusarium sp. LHS14.1]
MASFLFTPGPASDQEATWNAELLVGVVALSVSLLAFIAMLYDSLPSSIREWIWRYIWHSRGPTVSTEFIVPYYRNSRFVGRVEILDQVKRELTISSKRGIFKRLRAVQPRICLSGPSGVGKTQIALHHAYSLKEIQPDTSIFWVRANNIEQLYESYASIAQKCNIPGSSDIGFNPLDLVPWWLEKKAKSPWLMVVDGADDMESFFQTDQGKRMAGLANVVDMKQHGIAAYMPKCNHGSILFTTMNPESSLFTRTLMIEVGELNKYEASQLIRDALRYSDPQGDVDFLSLRLGYMPLSITLAISYIRTNAISIKDYIDLLRRVRPSVIDLRNSLEVTHPKEPNLPPEVIAPCLILLQKLEREDDFTNELLQHVSLFYHQGILRVFLSRYPTAESPDPMSTEASLSKLKRSSALLERDDDILEMHRLVRLVIQKLLLHKGEMVRATDKAMSAFWWSYPYGQPIAHSTLATYVLNAFSIFRCLEEFSWMTNAQKLAVMQTLEVYFESRGRWDDMAMRYAQKVVQSVEREREREIYLTPRERRALQPPEGHVACRRLSDG